MARKKAKPPAAEKPLNLETLREAVDIFEAQTEGTRPLIDMSQAKFEPAPPDTYQVIDTSQARLVPGPRLTGKELKAQQRQNRREQRLKEKGY